MHILFKRKNVQSFADIIVCISFNEMLGFSCWCSWHLCSLWISRTQFLKEHFYNNTLKNKLFYIYLGFYISLFLNVYMLLCVLCLDIEFYFRLGCFRYFSTIANWGKIQLIPDPNMSMSVIICDSMSSKFLVYHSWNTHWNRNAGIWVKFWSLVALEVFRIVVQPVTKIFSTWHLHFNSCKFM